MERPTLKSWTNRLVNRKITFRPRKKWQKLKQFFAILELVRMVKNDYNLEYN